MKVCILGVGRSGTTALYTLLQEILLHEQGNNIDFIYEPFLWDKMAFNGKYHEVRGNFQEMDSMSIEGIYHHCKLPLFITDPYLYKNNDYLERIFQKDNINHNILVKFIRANGRFLLLNEICPHCKFIFVIRNPIDVINSVIIRFSLYGAEFHKDDFKRFVKEVNSLYGEVIKTGEIKAQVEKEALYWNYMNRFALEAFKRVKSKPLIICYEDYVSNRKFWVDRLCDFLQLPKKDIYYDFAERLGGSKTKTVNLSRKEFKSLEGYLDTYKELLKMGGIKDTINYSRLTAKYEKFSITSQSRYELITGKTPNHMNDMIRGLKRVIAQKEEEIMELKQKLKKLGTRLEL